MATSSGAEAADPVQVVEDLATAGRALAGSAGVKDALATAVATLASSIDSVRVHVRQVLADDDASGPEWLAYHVLANIVEPTESAIRSQLGAQAPDSVVRCLTRTLLVAACERAEPERLRDGGESGADYAVVGQQ